MNKLYFNCFIVNLRFSDIIFKICSVIKWTGIAQRHEREALYIRMIETREILTFLKSFFFVVFSFVQLKYFAAILFNKTAISTLREWVTFLHSLILYLRFTVFSISPLCQVNYRHAERCLSKYYVLFVRRKEMTIYKSLYKFRVIFLHTNVASNASASSSSSSFSSLHSMTFPILSVGFG